MRMSQLRMPSRGVLMKQTTTACTHMYPATFIHFTRGDSELVVMLVMNYVYILKTIL